MKTLALTLCLLAACTLTCATQCGDECEPYYAPASLSRWSVSPLSNSGLEPVLAQEGDTLPRNAYGIRIACPADVLPADTVGASAFCGIEYLIDTPVISLRVYTLFDLDAQHPTGAEVTDLFRCRLPAG
ncbi:MAG TPA: hypothetical protein PK858_12870, partial [Saprospiraceae bacterium]|nr:hypothetical protein [Saprospiraceae bacterium]